MHQEFPGSSHPFSFSLASSLGASFIQPCGNEGNALEARKVPGQGLFLMEGFSMVQIFRKKNEVFIYVFMYVLVVCVFILLGSVMGTVMMAQLSGIVSGY